MIRNKIDLHLHIDGSVLPEDVYEISRRENIEPECNMSIEEITKEMQVQDGEYDPDFLTFEPPLRCMQSAEAIAYITENLVCRLYNTGVKYAELRFAPQLHCEKGLNQKQVVEAACKGLHQGILRCPGFFAGLILCTMNQIDASKNREQNFETVHLADEYKDQGVCGVDLAGYEDNMPDFKELFDLAHQLNLNTTTHSEFTVEQALTFGTSRIGHGYQFAMSPKLIKKAVETGITLEMCPVSSIKYEYGLTADKTHPLRVLFLAGAKVCVNTDNLTVLKTDLDTEYQLCHNMGFTDAEIEMMNSNAIEACFADDTVKENLRNLTR